MRFSGKRILRDVLILAGFCGAFVLFLAIFGGLETPQDRDNITFSPDRLAADRSKNRKDWETARINLRRILERDPFDGRAQYEFATSYYRERNNLINDLDELADLDQQNSEEAKNLQLNISELDDVAVVEFNKSKEFARYRARSLMILAVIEAERGKWDFVLDYLDKFVESGNYTYDGLGEARIFGSGGEQMTSPNAKVSDETGLHANPRFWDICRRELENRSQN